MVEAWLLPCDGLRAGSWKLESVLLQAKPQAANAAMAHLMVASALWPLHLIGSWQPRSLAPKSLVEHFQASAPARLSTCAARVAKSSRMRLSTPQPDPLRAQGASAPQPWHTWLARQLCPSGKRLTRHCCLSTRTMTV